jgi:hypothetical protein
MTLIAMFALVALPGTVGSRVPSPESTVDPGLFQRVEITALERGRAMTIQPLDPATRSAGNLDATTPLVEPAFRVGTGGSVRPAPPNATAGSISKSSWHLDPDISWYGPGFYGHRTACGLALTQTLVGVAHRTLPCGTNVAVYANGRIAIFKVVDRGPHTAGVTLDLTAAAARMLGVTTTSQVRDASW